MSGKIHGRVAIVTGAASGIGRHLSERLLQEGALLVALLDNNLEKGEETAKDLRKKYGEKRVCFLPVDVSKEKEITEAIKSVHDRFGCLDVMVNNAGIYNETKVTEVVTINLLGVMYGTLAAAELMSKRNKGRGGVIINTASIDAIHVASTPVYSASKFGIIGFTRNLPSGNIHFQSEGGVRVAAICPSRVQTPLVESSIVKNNSKADHEQRNILTTATVVEAYVKVIEDEQINGHILRVTPGLGIDVQQYESMTDLLKQFQLYKDEKYMLGLKENAFIPQNIEIT